MSNCGSFTKYVHGKIHFVESNHLSDLSRYIIVVSIRGQDGIERTQQWSDAEFPNISQSL